MWIITLVKTVPTCKQADFFPFHLEFVDDKKNDIIFPRITTFS